MERMESDDVLFHQNSESSIDIPAIENETNKFLITEHTSLAYFGFDIQDRSIIDFGCGNGHFLQAAARRGATKVYGLDNSSAAIEKAKLEWKELQECDSVDATFGVVDCIKSPINSMLDKDCGRFDYAISHCLTGYCQTKHGIETLLNNIFVALKPGGKVCLAVSSPQDNDNDASKRVGNQTAVSNSKTGASRSLGNYFWSVKEIIECMQAVKFVNCKRLNPIYPNDLATNQAVVEAVANDQWGSVMIGGEKPNLGVHLAKPAFVLG